MSRILHWHANEDGREFTDWDPDSPIAALAGLMAWALNVCIENGPMQRQSPQLPPEVSMSRDKMEFLRMLLSRDVSWKQYVELHVLLERTISMAWDQCEGQESPSRLQSMVREKFEPLHEWTERMEDRSAYDAHEEFTDEERREEAHAERMLRELVELLQNVCSGSVAADVPASAGEESETQVERVHASDSAKLSNCHAIVHKRGEVNTCNAEACRKKGQCGDHDDYRPATECGKLLEVTSNAKMYSKIDRILKRHCDVRWYKPTSQRLMIHERDWRKAIQSEVDSC